MAADPVSPLTTRQAKEALASVVTFISCSMPGTAWSRRPRSPQSNLTRVAFLAVTLLVFFRPALASDGCPHPPVPRAAIYANVSGGAGRDEWRVRYACDAGYELFGDAERTCKKGEWRGDAPHCAANVALHRPASASSESGSGGRASNAVDGRASPVHEVREKLP